MNYKKLLTAFAVLFIMFTTVAFAAPYAAIVIDAKTGEVIHEENAQTRLHPAGFTKLMALYAAYNAVETGLINLDEKVKISKRASEEPRVSAQLRNGQIIEFQNLIRATAVKGANDAATAMGEAVDGSISIFVRRMNGFSKELGLTRSTWKNPHGLTEKGHLSTAHDIAKLFIAHKRDFPEYFSTFARTHTSIGTREVVNSGRRILINIPGTKGVKYGYTRAAGFNGAAYVERGGTELVAVVFGGRSTATLVRQMQLVVDQAFADIPNK
jgi:D-alanyl-D-alanine carboxypeptidase